MWVTWCVRQVEAYDGFSWISSRVVLSCVLSFCGFSSRDVSSCLRLASRYYNQSSQLFSFVWCCARLCALLRRLVWCAVFAGALGYAAVFARCSSAAVFGGLRRVVFFGAAVSLRHSVLWCTVFVGVWCSATGAQCVGRWCPLRFVKLAGLGAVALAVR